METFFSIGRKRQETTKSLVVSLCLPLLGLVHAAHAQEEGEMPSAGAAVATRVVAIHGTNWWIAPRGARDWVLASTRVPQSLRPGDRLRTGRHTRLVLRTPHLGVIQVPAFTTLEIEAPPGRSKSTWIRLREGLLYFFHRGSPQDLEVRSPGASAAIRGTEFVAEAGPDGGLILQVLEGEVELMNDQGTVVLVSGDEGVAATGRAPVRTGVIDATEVIQWFLYYPVVLDSQELAWDEREKELLKESLEAYGKGDVLGALNLLPRGAGPESPRRLVYRTALLLGAGQLREGLSGLDKLTEKHLDFPGVGGMVGALQRMVAAVQRRVLPGAGEPESASAWLAQSYVRQSALRLGEALEAARRAVELSPGWGQAWMRRAELEFSFGRYDAARAALERGLGLAPRHPPGLVLKGFLELAHGRVAEAERMFEQALAVDPHLGNAWLGRGLGRINRGHSEAGLEDLAVAAALEPQRSVLRSYLGKAWAAAGETERARHELELARNLDPNDPTPWLYQALLDQQQNRINSGVRNLETSKELNQNRAVFRSQHLLDEDQAVRGANLAALYRDAGMVDVSRREAVDAIQSDYANASAHLFLANTYNELRDPGQADLRYESAWFAEFLLANLLAPAGAGTLSQTVSAQEFSRLFEQDRFGLASLTEYGSNGDWVQSAAHYGIQGGFSYALEEDYRFLNGQRRNHDLEQLTLSLKVKQQAGLRDSIYFQALYYEAEGGDRARVYDPNDPAQFRSRFRFEERQEPLLLGGYHRAWGPGQHTLFLAGRLHDELQTDDPDRPVLVVSRDPGGAVTGTVLTGVEEAYRSELEIYTGELQHIADWNPFTLVLGTRFHAGELATKSRQQNLADLGAALPEPLRQDVRPDLQRFSAYAYGQWKVADPLALHAGLSYDHLKFPSNHRQAPLLACEERREEWLPKAGLTWKPFARSTIRGAYTRSLSGVSLEQSVRLEPTQVAGFNQAWRSLIPESVAGAQAGVRFENAAVEWEHRFPSRTYVALRGDLSRSRDRREVGIFELPFLAEPSTARERLEYQEQSLAVTVNQLVGEDWSLGAVYHLSHAELEDDLPGIPQAVPHFFAPFELKPRQNLESTLHQVRLFAVMNHESGWFARLESLWSMQSNHGYSPDRPGDDFWQFNIYGGYRFPGRRAEIRLGILNLTDRDYRLNPLNLTPELPRDRTFTASLRWNL